MDYDSIIETCQSKLQQASNEMLEFIENAANYDAVLETAEAKEKIDTNDLEWNTANDECIFHTLENTVCIYERIIANLCDFKSAGDNKKKIHQLKKSIERLISSIRKLKIESNELIEREQKFTKEADSALDLLDELRGKA